MGKLDSTEALEARSLEPGCYFLYVSRMEPENHALEVREAFESVRTQMKLALIGDAPYSADYIRRVRATSDPRIIMPGAIYGRGYQELGSHCFAYIHATTVVGDKPMVALSLYGYALVRFPSVAWYHPQFQSVRTTASRRQAA